MTRQSHIEAVAKEINGKFNFPYDMAQSTAIATAAISALEKLGAYVGEGWEAVPSEPTEDIIKAGVYADFNEHGPLISERHADMLYRAMIAAAKPKPQGKE